MDLGVQLPAYACPLASPQAITEIAQAAERLGYTAVWAFERLLYALGDIVQPGSLPGPLPEFYGLTYDPIETLAYVAAKTAHVRLGTSIVNATFHTPVILGKRLATLDQLSGGRVIAGVGQGWMEEEFTAVNVSPKRRGAGFDEAITAMRATWGPDPVEFAGRFYRIPRSNINPKPVQPGGPPILLGAVSPAGIARAARVADGFNPVVYSYDALAASVQEFRDAACAAGRDPATLPVMARVNYPILPMPLPEAQRPFLCGSADQIAADLVPVAALGVDHVFFATGQAASIKEEIHLLEALQSAARDVLTSRAVQQPAATRATDSCSFGNAAEVDMTGWDIPLDASPVLANANR